MSTYFFFFFEKLKKKLSSVTSDEESPHCVCQFSQKQIKNLSKMLVRMRHAKTQLYLHVTS